ncbi:MAG TPA: DUF397 domain-containing protein [Trebonia sp.]
MVGSTCNPYNNHSARRARVCVGSRAGGCVTGSESAPITWRKSNTSSDSGNNCVEVSLGGEGVLVRHSRDPNGPVLSFTHSEWQAFLVGARNGEFDLP